MNDNAAVNAVIDKVDGATGAITRIAITARVTEIAVTTAAVNNCNRTNLDCLQAWGSLAHSCFRRRRRNDGCGWAMYFSYAATTAAAAGDSWIQFTENLTFEPAGDPAAIEQTQRNSQIIAGDVSDASRQAQPFVAVGNLTSVSAWLYKFGAPADNLIAEIQSDSAGNPSGTVIGTATVAGTR
jgi:hypothetical protein